MDISIVVATDSKNGIGLNENEKFSIPWFHKDDLKFFKKITSGVNKAIIVGRNTYFTFPKKDDIPILPNRLNIVLTSKPELIPKHENIKTFPSLNDAIDFFIIRDNESFKKRRLQRRHVFQKFNHY